jgi:CTP-dependent riboflavin kinase
MVIELQGTVCDGQGAAAGFTQLEWVRDRFRTQVGFDPYPGTLNLRVADAAALDSIRAGAGIAITPNADGACPARAWRLRIGGRVIGAWILPDVPNYPGNILEVMAPVSLRQTLGLGTGDSVIVQFLEANEPWN